MYWDTTTGFSSGFSNPYRQNQSAPNSRYQEYYRECQEGVTPEKIDRVLKNKMPARFIFETVVSEGGAQNENSI